MASDHTTPPSISARFGLLAYPIAGAGAERPLVACWVLALAAFLIPVLPLVPLFGYLARVLAASAASERSAPALAADPRRLLRRGLGASVLTAAFLAVPLVALLVTVYGATATSRGSGLSSGVIVYGGSTAVLCLAFVGAYLLPVGVVSYVRRGSLRAAFAPGTHRRIAGHAAYFTRWMAGWVGLSFAAAVASVALQIRRVGPVVAGLVLAYASILVCHVWGRGVAVAEAR